MAPGKALPLLLRVNRAPPLAAGGFRHVAGGKQQCVGTVLIEKLSLLFVAHGAAAVRSAAAAAIHAAAVTFKGVNKSFCQLFRLFLFHSCFSLRRFSGVFGHLLII